MIPLYGLRDTYSQHSKALQSVSIAVGRLNMATSIVEHLNLAQTRALLGLTQAAMGELLANYLDRVRPYTGTAVAVWEWYERNPDPAMRWKYAPTRAVVDAYRALIAIAVNNATGGRLMLCYHGGWHRYVMRADCRQCGREFTPRDTRQVHCSRCIEHRSHKCRQTRSQRQRSRLLRSRSRSTTRSRTPKHRR